MKLDNQSGFDELARIGFVPKHRSMKNTVPSGGFATDGFFNRTGLQAEVPHKIRNGIPRPVTLIDSGTGIPVPTITGRPNEIVGLMTMTRGSDVGAVSD